MGHVIQLSRDHLIMSDDEEPGRDIQAPGHRLNI